MFDLLQSHFESGITFELVQNFFQLDPERAFGGNKFLQINNHGRLEQLPPFDAEILGDELRAEFLVVQERITHAAMLQRFFQLAQIVP